MVARRAHNPKVVRFKSHPRNQLKTACSSHFSSVQAVFVLLKNGLCISLILLQIAALSKPYFRKLCGVEAFCRPKALVLLDCIVDEIESKIEKDTNYSWHYSSPGSFFIERHTAALKSWYDEAAALTAGRAQIQRLIYFIIMGLKMKFVMISQDGTENDTKYSFNASFRGNVFLFKFIFFLESILTRVRN